jgi:hypothetical protein
MRNVQMIVISLLMLQALVLPSEAAWLKQKPKEPDASEKVRTYQPPPANAMEEYCEPYRKRAYDLSNVHFWQKPFVIPQRTWAISRHRKCTDNLMQQEWEYLRHADIQKGPSLPKLRVEEQSSPQEGGASDANRP